MLGLELVAGTIGYFVTCLDLIRLRRFQFDCTCMYFTYAKQLAPLSKPAKSDLLGES